MRNMRVGVIGAGGRGYISQFAHNQAIGSALVAACDSNPNILKDFRQRYVDGILLTADYRELLGRSDIDAVLITTPDNLHQEHAVAALAAHKAVYCEKPLAISIDGADSILKAAMLHKQKLFVGHNMRYMPFVQKMKELIDANAIGEIKTVWCRHFIAYGGDAYFKDWHAERKHTTGLLLQKGSHDLDVIHWLCGAYAARVSGFGALTVYDQCHRRKAHENADPSWHTEHWPPLAQKNLNPHMDVEDVNLLNLRLANGVLVAYEQCHFTPDAWRNYTFIGTAGRLENIGDFTTNCEIRIWNKRTGFNEKGDDRIKIALTEGDHGGADRVIVEEFIRFARDGATTVSSPVAARYSVAAAYQGTMSIRNNGIAMDVPEVDADLLAYFSD